MQILRVQSEDGRIRWAIERGHDRIALPDDESLGSLLSRTRRELEDHLAAAVGGDVDGSILAPVDDDTEVWAAGVTYQVSREAREAESEQSADVYRQIYEADRPELFFKSIGWRTVGADAPIGIRRDSRWDVPEPELAVVANAAGEIVGYTLCNDVSSRSIEGTNPLYLPQAKMYAGSCAVGPVITLASTVADPYDLMLSVTIDRDGTPVYAAETSTGLLDRSLQELVDWLFAAQEFPRGAVLSTGTCLVPPESVTLEVGDVVTIDIDELGTLSNIVEEVGSVVGTGRQRRSQQAGS